MPQTKEISLRKMNWLLFLMGIVQIPLIGFVRPKLIEINDEVVKVKIKLRRRTKNHLKSMYFGALAVGADIAAGIHVFYFSETKGVKTSFAFKGMKADFIKRAESDVTFVCDEGKLIASLLSESIEKNERINHPVMVKAMDAQNEIVATFEMIISLKVI
jgi:acyl-coenzyme A thioesterase PaaI-like protein